jgi:hypothetical protein
MAGIAGLGQQSLVLAAPTLADRSSDIAAALRAAGMTVDEHFTLLLDATRAEKLLRSLAPVPLPDDPISTAMAGVTLQPPSAAFQRAAIRLNMTGHAGSAPSSPRIVARPGVPLGVVEAFAADADDVGAGTHGQLDGSGRRTAVFVVSVVDPRIDVCEKALLAVGSEDPHVLHAQPGTLRHTFGLRHAPYADSIANGAGHHATSGSASFRGAGGGAHIAHIQAPAAKQYAHRALVLVNAWRAAEAAAAAAAAGGSSSAGGAAAMPSTEPRSPGARPTPQPALPVHLQKSHLVDMDQLLTFVFPPGLQHPRSTGRLLVFGLYGPLTADGRLTGGRGGTRLLTESDIKTMIEQLEMDDVMAVFTRGSVLGDVRQVAVDVKAASLPLPHMSRRQVEDMLADLPRDSHGRCSFHDIQARLLAVRAGRVRDMGQMFPSVVTADPDAARTRIRPPSPKFGRGKLAQTAAATLQAAGATGGAAGYTHLVGSASFGAAQARAGPAVGLGTSRGSRAAATSAMTVGGLDVTRKMGDVERYRAVAGLQHRNIHMVANLADLHDAAAVGGVADNVKIIRGDIPASKDGFDRDAPRRLSPNRGTYVPGGLARMDLLKRKI